RLASEEDVAVDLESGDEVELLRDDANAGPLGVLGRAEGELLAVEEEPAKCGRVAPRQDLHGRALSRPVLADDAQDLAGVDLDADVGEDAHRRELLADALGPQE